MVFKIPIIIFCSINSILSVGLQPYLEQGHISAMVAGISLIVSILGSIELYMKIQENMEVELVAQKDLVTLSYILTKLLLICSKILRIARVFENRKVKYWYIPHPKPLKWLLRNPFPKNLPKIL